MKLKPYTTLLCNKVAAFIAVDMGGVHELARFVSVAPPRVSDWITSRKYAPGYEYGKNIEAWLVTKEAELAAAPAEKQREFRAAFDKVSKEFPHEKTV
jgi:hypothetical protein